MHTELHHRHLRLHERRPDVQPPGAEVDSLRGSCNVCVYIYIYINTHTVCSLQFDYIKFNSFYDQFKFIEYIKRLIQLYPFGDHPLTLEGYRES